MKLHAVGWSLFFAYSGTFFKKKWLVLSCTVSYNHAKKTSSPFLRKAVLTTFLTIDRFGTRGSSGEDRFGKHGIRSGKRQKRTEKIRKMFLQFFGTKRPWVRVPQPGPKVQNPLVRSLDFSVCVSETRTMAATQTSVAAVSSMASNLYLRHRRRCKRVLPLKPQSNSSIDTIEKTIPSYYRLLLETPIVIW